MRVIFVPREDDNKVRRANRRNDIAYLREIAIKTVTFAKDCFYTNPEDRRLLV